MGKMQRVFTLGNLCSDSGTPYGLVQEKLVNHTDKSEIGLVNASEEVFGKISSL